MANSKQPRFNRDDTRRILGYDVCEMQVATKAYLSELVEQHAPGYRLERVTIKLGTSNTYMRQQSQRDSHVYSMTVGLQNVLGHCQDGLQEYKSIRKNVRNYGASGVGRIGNSHHYIGLRAWNAILLHELTHMLNYIYETGSYHDDGFVREYNKLLSSHMSVDQSLLSVLNAHDLERAANSTCEVNRSALRERIFRQTSWWKATE